MAGALLLLFAGAGVWTQTDLDGDGLDALTEVQGGTDPFLADTDLDGLPDGWERDRGTDPLSRDTDADGLSDQEELTLRLDPLSNDSDDDTLLDPAELEAGTDPASSDTDGDRLDDALEARFGTHPLRADGDGDGLSDSQDLLAGANPHNSDTDQDSLSDGAEVDAGNPDCDGDGGRAVADADDDADGRRDADEPTAHRCQPDVDQDGVLDGHEVAVACITLADCDVDGIPDGPERETRFDPLDPDTFDVGLLDGVSLAFEARGQPPSRDEDFDGIPDAWEQAQGLIDWGPFDPEPGRQDLLIEFVRVHGPDSGRYAYVDLTPSYDRVETFFKADGGVEAQWTETVVGLDEERRPPLLPSGQATYYRDLLAQAQHASNPFVTTVVLNPQHNQSQLLHLGVAPIRGMLAAVDYGAHTEIEFRVQDSDQRLKLSPFLESVIAAGHRVTGPSIQASGLNPQGRMYLAGQNWTLSWQPYWFQPYPFYEADDGFQAVLLPLRAIVDHEELSYTITHEMGHTLGLCHTDLPSCQQGLPQASRGILGTSTMDTTTQDRTALRFLEAEWEQARTFLRCPPVRPVTLLSQGASVQEVVDAKYAITLENALDVGTRSCEVHDPIPADLEPAPDPGIYTPPRLLDPGELTATPVTYQDQRGDGSAPVVFNTRLATGLFAAAVLAGASLAAGGAYVALRRRWPGV